MTDDLFSDLEFPAAESITVLVTGGRHFADRNRLWAKLDEIHDGGRVAKVIHGGASGADGLAGEWAASRTVACQVFRAAWSVDGRAAGPIRNARMLAEGKPDLVIACPGNKGTADMVCKAKAAGVRVVYLEESEEVQ